MRCGGSVGVSRVSHLWGQVTEDGVVAPHKRCDGPRYLTPLSSSTTPHATCLLHFTIHLPPFPHPLIPTPSSTTSTSYALLLPPPALQWRLYLPYRLRPAAPPARRR